MYACLNDVERCIQDFKRNTNKLNSIRMNCSKRQIEMFIQTLLDLFNNSDYCRLIDELEHPTDQNNCMWQYKQIIDMIQRLSHKLTD